MTKALNYESLIRQAFGFVAKGEMIDRGGDPAGIADTDFFNPRNIDRVKIGVGYAMEIMSNAVMDCDLPDGEVTRLEGFTSRVLSALTIDDIDRLIGEYRETVISTYFDISDGRIKLEC